MDMAITVRLFASQFPSNKVQVRPRSQRKHPRSGKWLICTP